MLPGAKTRVSDYLWAVVAAIMAVALLHQLVVSTAAVVRSPTGEQLLSFLVVALLTLIAGWWLVAGAWRRTVWGAPLGRVREHRERRFAAKASSQSTDEP